MNKSKILKKSLAAILAIMMVVVGIPLSAAAAGSHAVTSVKVMPLTGVDNWSPNITLTKDGDTFKGNIPDYLTQFTLQIGTNSTWGGGVSRSPLYLKDMADAAGEYRALESGGSATSGIYVSTTVANGQAFTSSKLPAYVKGDKVNITIAAEDGSGARNEYKIELTKVPVDPQSGTLVKAFELKRQIGDTVIDNVNRTITIQVPFGEKDPMTGNGLRKIELSAGAKAYAGSASGMPLVVKPNYGTDPGFNIGENDIYVGNGGENDIYKLIINRAPGLNMFSFEGAEENFVDSENGKIYVRFPYGYINDNKDSSNKISLVANFTKQFESVTVKQGSTVLESGKTQVKNMDAAFGGGFQKSRIGSTTTGNGGEDYSAATLVFDESKPLVDQKATLFSGAGPINATEITVEYTDYEGTLNSLSYEVVLLEPVLGTGSQLTAFSIGSEAATINQETKTIDITLPKSYESRLDSIDFSEILFEGSKNAAIVSGADNSAGEPSVMFGEIGEDGTGTAGKGTGTFLSGTEGDFSDKTGIRVEVYSELEANLASGSNAYSSQLDNVYDAGPSRPEANIYTLNITISDETVGEPSLNTMTLEDPDGNQYPATVDQTTKNINFSGLPYNIKWNQANMADWKLYYTKAPGTTVLLPDGDTFGGAGPVWIDAALPNKSFAPSGIKFNYSETGGSAPIKSYAMCQSDMWPSADKGRTTAGKGFAVQSMDYIPGTSGQGTKYMYTITMSCNAANTGSSIKSFGASTDPEGSNDIYTASVNTVNAPAEGEITLKLPYSVANNMGIDGAYAAVSSGTPLNVDILEQLYAQVELDEGAVMYIAQTVAHTGYSDNGNASNRLDTDGNPIFLDDAGATGIIDGTDTVMRKVKPGDLKNPAFSAAYLDPAYSPDSLTVFVFSEEYAERWLKGIDVLAWTDTAFVDVLGSGAKNTSVVSQINSDNGAVSYNGNLLDAFDYSQYKVYNLKVEIESPKTNHSLDEVKLIDADGKEVKADLTIAGGSIKGTIPYSAAHEVQDFYKAPYFLKFKASENAIVGLANTSVPGVNGLETYKAKDPTKAGDGGYLDGNAYDTYTAFVSGGQDFYDGSTVYAYDPDGDIDDPMDKSSGSATGVGDVPTNGNAGIQLTANGTSGVTVDYLTSAGTVGEGTQPGKIGVLAEDGMGYSEYELALSYAPANTEAKIKSFKIGSSEGVINETAKTITVTLPFGSEKTSLKAEWENSDFSLVSVDDYGSVESGVTEINYSKPVTFTVKAENGTESKYVVTVNVRTDFSDVFTTDWFYDEVMEAARRGYVTGYEDGSFRPNNDITRGEFAVLFCRAEGADLSAYKDTSAFPDVTSDAYYSAAIAYCADKGIVNGFEDGKFHADEKITREQMAKVMALAKALHPIMAPQKRFDDDSAIADWAKPYVYACKEAGIVEGYDDNTFGATDNLLRCQAAAAFVRSYNK